jgi:hypothetical protein
MTVSIPTIPKYRRRSPSPSTNVVGGQGRFGEDAGGVVGTKVPDSVRGATTFIDLPVRRLRIRPLPGPPS